jgi:hypothetical protein
MHIEKIKTPSPETPLYTYESYINDCAAGLKDSSFGFVFFDTYFKNSKRALDLAIPVRIKTQITREGFDGAILSEINNHYEKDIRWHIDRALQEYLAKNDGVIEAWPHHVFSRELVEKTTYTEYDPEEDEKTRETHETGRFYIDFDYFGTEFIKDPEDPKKHIRKSPGKCHRYDRYTLTDDFENAKHQKWSLERDMEKAKNNPFQEFKQFIAYLPAVLFILCDILLIIGAVFGIEGIRETIGPFIPFYMSLSSVEGYSAVHMFFMPFIGCIISVFLNEVLEPEVANDVKSYKEQKKLYEDYINSDEYKKILAEGPVNSKNYNSQSAAWHKEWFDAIKAHTTEAV